MHGYRPDDTAQDTAFVEMSAGQRERAMARLDRLAWLLDARWRIPGTRIRFGLDPIISFAPILGDLLAAAIASTIVWHAGRFGAPRMLIFQMMLNLVIDVVFGSVPIVGTVFDVFFKASRKNMRLLRKHLEKTGQI